MSFLTAVFQLLVELASRIVDFDVDALRAELTCKFHSTFQRVAYDNHVDVRRRDN